MRGNERPLVLRFTVSPPAISIFFGEVLGFVCVVFLFGFVRFLLLSTISRSI